TQLNRQLAQPVLLVHNRVHRVESQTIETELLQPIQGVVGKKAAHRAAAKIDGRAPRRLPVLTKELGGVVGQVIAHWPEVVVDHVEVDNDAQYVSGFDLCCHVN